MEQSYQNYKNVLQARMKNLLDDYGDTGNNPVVLLASPDAVAIQSVPGATVSKYAVPGETNPNIKSPVVPIKVAVPSPEFRASPSNQQQAATSKMTSNNNTNGWGFLDVLIWIIILVMLALLGYICYLLYLMCSNQSGGCWWSVQNSDSQDE